MTIISLVDLVARGFRPDLCRCPSGNQHGRRLDASDWRGRNRSGLVGILSLEASKIVIPWDCSESTGWTLSTSDQIREDEGSLKFPHPRKCHGPLPCVAVRMRMARYAVVECGLSAFPSAVQSSVQRLMWTVTVSPVLGPLNSVPIVPVHLSHAHMHWDPSSGHTSGPVSIGCRLYHLLPFPGVGSDRFSVGIGEDVEILFTTAGCFRIGLHTMTIR